MPESRASYQFRFAGDECPSIFSSYDAVLLFRLPTVTLGRIAYLRTLGALTLSKIRSRLSIAAEFLVLTDFGVCPLVELCLSGEWSEQRR